MSEHSQITIAERQSDRIKEALSDLYEDAETVGEQLQNALCDLRHLADTHGINFTERDKKGQKFYLEEMEADRAAQSKKEVQA